MTILKLCMATLLIVTASSIIRSWKSDFLPLIRIGSIVLFGVLLIASTEPLLSLIATLGTGIGIGSTQYVETILKGIGIVFLTQICADICRDSGEGALAGHIETVGKLELLLLCVPLIEEILATAEKLLTMGG